MQGGTPIAEIGAPVLSLVRSRLALLRRRTSLALDASDEERRLHGLKRAVALALVIWPSLLALDVAATYLAPGRLWFYLALRSAGVAILALAALRLRSPSPISARAVFAMDVALTTSLAALVSLACLELGGITSPLVVEVIALVLARSVLLPDFAERNVWAIGGAALAFVAVGVLLAIPSDAIRAQWTDMRSIGTFAMHVGCVFTAAAIGSGGHFLTRYRSDLRDARTLARYDLLCVIGRGGMGEIWRARDRILGREVALKILRSDRDDLRTAARFEREVRKTASLRHPNTIRVFDYGTTDGRAYYSMELLDGCDLSELVAAKGPLAPERAIEIARQAADALAEAHALRIVHRDIKPENLFVLRGERDFVKVLDFGLAKVVGADPGLTSDGCIVGTPSCIAPEVIRSAEPDARTDLYALGCVLYFMLTSTPPLAGTTRDVLVAHAREVPELPSVRLAKLGHPSRVPPAIERVVMRCMEKAPDERFQSARELAQALATCVQPIEPTLEDLPITESMRRRDEPDTIPATIPAA
jgi:serine/threonine-protein kinase